VLPKVRELKDRLNEQQQIEDKCLLAFEEADKEMNREMQYYDQMNDEEDDRPVKKEDLLARHKAGYKFYKNQYKHNEKVQKFSYENLMADIHENPIAATKYNYTIEPSIMNNFQVECEVHISKDGKELIVTNKKPNDYPTYTYEEMPDDIRNGLNE